MSMAGNQSFQCFKLAGDSPETGKRRVQYFLTQKWSANSHKFYSLFTTAVLTCMKMGRSSQTSNAPNAIWALDHILVLPKQTARCLFD